MLLKSGESNFSRKKEAMTLVFLTDNPPNYIGLLLRSTESTEVNFQYVAAFTN